MKLPHQLTEADFESTTFAEYFGAWFNRLLDESLMNRLYEVADEHLRETVIRLELMTPKEETAISDMGSLIPPAEAFRIWRECLGLFDEGWTEEDADLASGFRADLEAAGS